MAATSFTDELRRFCGGSRVLVWLVSINVIFSFILWLASMVSGLTGLSASRLASWFSLSAEPAVFITHPWTLVTYMFAQYSLLHLLFNVLWLLWFGRIILYISDESALLRLYIGGGICGALLYMAANYTGLTTAMPGGYLCGASASVIAIMSAAGLMAPEMRLRLFLFGECKLKWVAVICVLLIFFGSSSQTPGRTLAHAGGLTFGVLYWLWQKKSFYVKLAIDRKIRQREEKRRGAAVAKAVRGRLCDTERLDQLLDRMKSSGFDSLSEREKKELNAISDRLRNEKN